MALPGSVVKFRKIHRMLLTLCDLYQKGIDKGKTELKNEKNAFF